MAITLTQTDTAAVACGPANAVCDASSAVFDQEWTATSGGTAGITARSTPYSSSQTLARFVLFQSAASEPNNAVWASGNWVIRLEVTTANTNISWVRSFVCRVSNACANLATVGSITGQTTSLGTTGVKTHTVSGASQVASVTDEIAIVLIGSNGAMSLQSVSWKASQNIDTPVTQGGSSTPITGTDSATVSDSATMAAALANADTPTATETQSTTLDTSSSDNATLADTPRVGVDGSESGTTTDGASLAANIPTTDSPAATETQSTIVAQTATDSGALSDSAVPSATQTSTDSVTLSDTSNITIPLSSSDSGTATDGASLSAQTTATDSENLSDVAVTTVSTSTSDSAALSDSAQANAQTASSDVVSVSDTQAVAIPISGSEVAAATDGASVSAALTGSDAATLSDTALQTVSVAASDAGTVSDTAASNVTASDADNAVSTQGAILTAALSGGDTSALTESASVATFSTSAVHLNSASTVAAIGAAVTVIHGTGSLHTASSAKGTGINDVPVIRISKGPLGAGVSGGGTVDDGIAFIPGYRRRKNPSPEQLEERRKALVVAELEKRLIEELLVEDRIERVIEHHKQMRRNMHKILELV